MFCLWPGAYQRMARCAPALIGRRRMDSNGGYPFLRYGNS